MLRASKYALSVWDLGFVADLGVSKLVSPFEELFRQLSFAQWSFNAHKTCPVKLPSDVLDSTGDLGDLTTPTACNPGP